MKCPYCKKPCVRNLSVSPNWICTTRVKDGAKERCLVFFAKNWFHAFWVRFALWVYSKA